MFLRSIHHPCQECSIATGVWSCSPVHAARGQPPDAGGMEKLLRIQIGCWADGGGGDGPERGKIERGQRERCQARVRRQGFREVRQGKSSNPIR